MCETRPGFSELCDCVGISLSASQQAHFDWLQAPVTRQEFLRKVYNAGATYYADAACPACQGCGIPLAGIAA